MHLLKTRNISVFRYNTDEYYKYQFLWNEDTFRLKDPCNRTLESSDIDIAVFYKSLITMNNKQQIREISEENTSYVEKHINYVTNALALWASEKNKLHLWELREYRFSKMRQMLLAKKYFSVPNAKIHWGFIPRKKNVMFKTLTPFISQDFQYTFVSRCDMKQLDPKYPWFTQEIANGNRDATVLYINGNVHCFQFATPRGKLTDWRVTQGTELNKWEPWHAGKVFEEKIKLYMRDIGLKYGRLDFIIGGKNPQFLEVNPTGQFGWLDNENGFPLHNEIIDAILDPTTTITL